MRNKISILKILVAFNNTAQTKFLAYRIKTKYGPISQLELRL